MKLWAKVLIGIGTLVVALLVVVFSLLRTTASVPPTCKWTMDLAEVRAAAGSLAGDKATEIRAEHVTTIEVPEAVVFTGGAFAKTQMSMYAYQLVFADQTIVIDSAMSDGQAKQMGPTTYDADGWGRVAKGLKAATAIYVTHEHGDHLGGIVALLDDPQVAAHAHLTREQLANPDGLKPMVIPPDKATQLNPLSYEKLQAVAPGVVLIKAPGHTPGSQMVYVQKQDGRELILTGDTAWHIENIDRVSGPPKLIHVMMHNDDDANVCQLAALHDIATKTPDVRIMPGHDARRMKQLLDDGTLTMRFR